MRLVWPALVAFLVVVFCAGCEHVDGANGPITGFTAEKEKVTKGKTTHLTATFDSGTGSIDNDVGEVTSGAPVETKELAGKTTFTLTVIDAETGQPFTQ